MDVKLETDPEGEDYNIHINGWKGKPLNSQNMKIPLYEYGNPKGTKTKELW